MLVLKEIIIRATATSRELASKSLEGVRSYKLTKNGKNIYVGQIFFRPKPRKELFIRGRQRRVSVAVLPAVSTTSNLPLAKMYQIYSIHVTLLNQVLFYKI